MFSLKEGESKVAAKGAAKGILWVPPAVLFFLALAALAILVVPAIRAWVEVVNHRNRTPNTGTLDRLASWQLARSCRKGEKKEAEYSFDQEKQEAGAPAPAVS